MKVTIIGFTGRAGSGKDTIAQALIENRGFVKRSMAEPLYRIMKLEVAKQNGDLAAPWELFDLTRDLFGSPAGPPLDVVAGIALNEYTKIANETGLMNDINSGTKPRRFLQYVGTEFFRAYNEDTWVDYFIKQVVSQVRREREDHLHALEAGETKLRAVGRNDVSGEEGGSIPEPHVRIVITDVRFDNEGAMLYRLVQELNEIAPDVHASKHLICLDLTKEEAARRVAVRDDISVQAVLANMGHASEAGVDQQYIDETIDASRSVESICRQVFNLLDGKKSLPTLELPVNGIIPNSGSVIDLSQFAKKKG